MPSWEAQLQLLDMLWAHRLLSHTTTSPDAPSTSPKPVSGSVGGEPQRREGASLEAACAAALFVRHRGQLLRATGLGELIQMVNAMQVGGREGFPAGPQHAVLGLAWLGLTKSVPEGGMGRPFC